MPSDFNEMSAEFKAELINAVQSDEQVSGYTHDFYRYPARFSPIFARTAIKLFTKPGDIVFDPFMGGATTLVEARALGRRSIGTDINKLSYFLAKTKTTILFKMDIDIMGKVKSVCFTGHRPDMLGGYEPYNPV